MRMRLRERQIGSGRFGKEKILCHTENICKKGHIFKPLWFSRIKYCNMLVQFLRLYKISIDSVKMKRVIYGIVSSRSRFSQVLKFIIHGPLA